MVHYFSPYAVDKDFGKAYNDYMKLVQSDDDWICFIDLDAMFLVPDIGHQIQEIVDKYPNAGLFTCVTNRVGNLDQCYNSLISEDPNVLNHRKIALQLSKEKRHQVKEIKNPISGHLMLVKKSTWKAVGGFPENRGILSVDNTFSNRIARNGYNILLMEGVYLFHFYRMDTGRFNKSHLK